MAAATNDLDGLALASPVIVKSVNHKIWLLPLLGLFIVGSVVSVWWWQQAKPQQTSQTAIASVTVPVTQTTSPKAAVTFVVA